LENHWKGEFLDSVEKVLGLARTMSWKGCNPIVNFVQKNYQKGVSLTKKAMEIIETKICRINGIEKWAVDILCYD